MIHKLIGVLLCLASLGARAQSASIKIKSTNDFEIKADSNLQEWKTTTWVTLGQTRGR